MTLPRVFIIAFCLLFGTIGVLAFMKDHKREEMPQSVAKAPIEINLHSLQPAEERVIVEQAFEEKIEEEPAITVTASESTPSLEKETLIVNDSRNEPSSEDRVGLLFENDSSLPIVETIQYKSRVPWKQGRSAWLVDYATHYKTPLHFILRSVNGKADYTTAKTIKDGQKFNVLRTDKNFYFHLVVDLSRCNLHLYYVLEPHQEKVFLKTYRVGLGRPDSSKPSGSLTPIGKYRLGPKITVYQPKMKGRHKGKRVEMITVFGTRWIPFEKELGECSAPAKGFGLHGTPWSRNSEGQLADNTSSIGKYEGDGCIRLATQDIEELYSIITTRKSVIEIVRQYASS